MKRFLTALAALLGCLMPAAVSAESWVLHQSGAWQVEYVDDPHPHCLMGNLNVVEEFGLIVINDGSGPQGLLVDTAEIRTPMVGTIHAWVDREQTWTITANAKGAGIRFRITDPDFLAQLYRGHQLFIDVNTDRQWDYRFSLSGSAKALTVLADCIGKL